MTRGKIVVTSPIHAQVRRRLQTAHEVVCNETAAAWSAARLIEQARDAQAIMAFMPDRISAEIQDSLRMSCQMSSGQEPGAHCCCLFSEKMIPGILCFSEWPTMV